MTAAAQQEVRLIAVRGNKSLQSIGERKFLGVVKVQQRSAEIIPGLHKLKKGHRCNRRR